MRTSCIFNKSKSPVSVPIAANGPSTMKGSGISTSDYIPLLSNSINDTGMPREMAEEQIKLLHMSNMELLKENFILKNAIIATYKNMNHYLPTITGIPALPEDVGTNQISNAAANNNQIESAMNGIRTLLLNCSKSALPTAQSGDISVANCHTRRSYNHSSLLDCNIRQPDNAYLYSDPESGYPHASQFRTESLSGSSDITGESLLQIARHDHESLASDSVPLDSSSYFADISNSFSPVQRKTLRRIISLKNRTNMKTNSGGGRSRDEVLANGNIDQDNTPYRSSYGKLTRSKIFDNRLSSSSFDETTFLKKRRRRMKPKKRKNISFTQRYDTSDTSTEKLIGDNSSIPGILGNFDSTDSSTKEPEVQCTTLNNNSSKESNIKIEIDSIRTVVDGSNDLTHSEPDESDCHVRCSSTIDKQEAPTLDFTSKSLDEDKTSTEEPDLQSPNSKSNRYEKNEPSIMIPKVQFINSKSNYLDQDIPSTIETKTKVIKTERIFNDKNSRFTSNQDGEIVALTKFNDGDVSSTDKLKSQIMTSKLNDVDQCMSRPFTSVPVDQICIPKSSFDKAMKIFTPLLSDVLLTRKDKFNDSQTNHTHNILPLSDKNEDETMVSMLRCKEEEQCSNKPEENKIDSESNDDENTPSGNPPDEKKVDSKLCIKGIDHGENLSSDVAPEANVSDVKSNVENIQTSHKLEDESCDLESYGNTSGIKLEEIIRNSKSEEFGSSDAESKQKSQLSKEPLGELDEITWMKRLLDQPCNTFSSRTGRSRSVSRTGFESDDDLFDNENKTPETLSRKRKQDSPSGEFEIKKRKRQRRYSE